MMRMILGMGKKLCMRACGVVSGTMSCKSVGSFRARIKYCYIRRSTRRYPRLGPFFASRCTLFHALFPSCFSDWTHVVHWID